jgi:uncharacterized protein (DUF1697 family)
VPRYIALLRAINVGGHVVKMDRLRSLFEALKLTNVETFIASGNVIFDTRSAHAAALERKIEAHLERELGYAVGTYLRTPAEIVAAAAHDPFAPRSDASSLYIGFLKEAPSDAVRQKLRALSTEYDRLDCHDRQYYWSTLGRLTDSKISGPVLDKTLGMPGTMRNVTTVRRLADKYGGET